MYKKWKYLTAAKTTLDFSSLLTEDLCQVECARLFQKRKYITPVVRVHTLFMMLVYYESNYTFSCFLLIFKALVSPFISKHFVTL